MDERELVSQIVEIVDATAYRNQISRVVEVRVAIGGRRVFDLARLQAVFHDATRNTVAESCQLVVQILPVQHRCYSCGGTFAAGASDCPCPQCGHPHTEAINGEEIRVVDMQGEVAGSGSAIKPEPTEKIA